MTVQSNHAIALVLVSFPFLIGSKKLWVITQPIRNKLGIGVSLTSKSNCLVKPMVVLVLGCVTPSCLRFPRHQIRHAFCLFLPFFHQKMASRRPDPSFSWHFWPNSCQNHTLVTSMAWESNKQGRVYKRGAACRNDIKLPPPSFMSGFCNLANNCGPKETLFCWRNCNSTLGWKANQRTMSYK